MPSSHEVLYGAFRSAPICSTATLKAAAPKHQTWRHNLFLCCRKEGVKVRRVQTDSDWCIGHVLSLDLGKQQHAKRSMGTDGCSYELIFRDSTGADLSHSHQQKTLCSVCISCWCKCPWCPARVSGGTGCVKFHDLGMGVSQIIQGAFIFICVLSQNNRNLQTPTLRKSWFFANFSKMAPMHVERSHADP